MWKRRRLSGRWYSPSLKWARVANRAKLGYKSYRCKSYDQVGFRFFLFFFKSSCAICCTYKIQPRPGRNHSIRPFLVGPIRCVQAVGPLASSSKTRKLTVNSLEWNKRRTINRDAGQKSQFAEWRLYPPRMYVIVMYPPAYVAHCSWSQGGL